MKVIVDTCIWSEAFRKKQTQTNKKYIEELIELIKEGSVILLGAIRQELLSGIKLKKDFELLKNQLRAFDNFNLSEADYELAAELFNQCRSKGIQGSNTDFLICSVAIKNNYSIYTTDKDFNNFSKHISINLHKIRKHSG
jgi:predicted nucleic acid-binding protein